MHPNRSSPTIRILLIAQPSIAVQALQDLLEQHGYDVSIATTSEALPQIFPEAPDLVLFLQSELTAPSPVNQERTEFMAHITHDLRVPLIAASQLLYQMQQGILGTDLVELQPFLQQLTASHQTLVQLIDTLLDIHQYEVGGRELDTFPVDLAEVIGQTIAELQPLADFQGLALEGVNAAENLAVIGDRLELRRLFTNLISNAIQFTDIGSVQVQATSYRDAANQQWVAVSVEDTGIGIAEDEQAMLFERFRQGRQRRSGHGLGLYLCRQIVEAHRGRIEVRSTPGEGTCFTVHLPRSRLTS
jgi:two-component system, sensor histidine kinase and response regulator